MCVTVCLVYIGKRNTHNEYFDAIILTKLIINMQTDRLTKTHTYTYACMHICIYIW